MGKGLTASVVCMYVRHAFGMQLIFGKDRSGFRNASHIALKNVAGRTWRRTFVLKRQPGS